MGSWICAAAYQPEDNDIRFRMRRREFDALRTIAVSRITWITSTTSRRIGWAWIETGASGAQLWSRRLARNDHRGTHFPHAGAKSPQLQTEAALFEGDSRAGRTPVQRNTFYEPIKVGLRRAQATLWRTMKRVPSCWQTTRHRVANIIQAMDSSQPPKLRMIPPETRKNWRIGSSRTTREPCATGNHLAQTLMPFRVARSAI